MMTMMTFFRQHDDNSSVSSRWRSRSYRLHLHLSIHKVRMLSNKFCAIFGVFTVSLQK